MAPDGYEVCMPFGPRRRGRRPRRGAAARRCAAVVRLLGRKERQLRALGEISAALSSARELEATLEVITRISSEVMGVASCSIYLQCAPLERLVLAATTGLSRAAIGRASLLRGEGLTGWAVEHGRALAVRDVAEDPRFKLLPETEEENLRSLLAVPLSVEGRVIGAMNVQTIAPHEYTVDEVELLSLIASLAAGALEKAALHDRMRKQIAELEGLVTVSRTVISPLYLDDMLGVVAEMATRLMGARAVVLHLCDEASGELTVRATHNLDPVTGPSAAPALGEPIVRQAAEEARPIAVAALGGEAPDARGTGSASGSGCGMLAVPLGVRGRTVGVLSCYAEGPHTFGPQEIDLFSALANQTALAIENARLAISTAVVREMHHRVKNNLQTVAMVLRLQMHADSDPRTRSILGDAMTRILSIAAVHETLSERGLELVDVKQVLERVAGHVAALAPDRRIGVAVQGDSLTLPSRVATWLALATSELLQNAFKHAFPERAEGRVVVTVRAGRAEHQIEVADDGIGERGPRPTRKGLGHEIVETLVQNDLKGRFEIHASAAGTRALLRFPPSSEGAKA